MGCLKVMGLLVAVFALYVGYCLHSVRPPPYISDQGTALRYMGSYKLFQPVFFVLAKLGINEVNVVRTVWGTAMSFDMKTNPNVKVTVDSFDGVRVRIFDPVDRKPGGPAVVYFHGGGWVIFTPESYHNPVQMIAEETKFLVVSVDYRLAPEHKYPAAVDDCQKATEYLIKHASKYNIDPKRIAVMGDSAGGNLAAAVSISLQKAPIRPKLQVPIYPVLQGMDYNLPSYQNDTKILLSREQMPVYVILYLLGKEVEKIDHHILHLAETNRLISESVWQEHGHKLAHSVLPKKNFHKEYKQVTVPEDNIGFSEKLDKLVAEPRFAPLMADDLTGLPEALFLTCQHDVLRDESFVYAERLKKAGVKVNHFHDMDCFHGAITMANNHPMLSKANQFLVKNL